MRVVIDAMGGDHAPQAMVEGAVLAVAAYDCTIDLVGQEPALRELLAGRGDGKINIVHASEVIDMHDKAATAVRAKKDSSMSVALARLNTGEADAMVSSGSTGALLTGATLVTKRIRGIRRAALTPLLPTQKGKALLIDCGANLDCTPEYLLQFAYMGHFYMQGMMGIKAPRIGLLNNGAEPGKGPDLQRETYRLLQQEHEAGRLNFVGNVEGRDVPMGACDVVVCDGFSGNILLKTMEGVGLFLIKELKGIFTKNGLSKLAALAVRPPLRAFREKMDYKETGGAPMLGISKPIIKAHGSCDAYAFKSAIGQAIAYHSSGFIDKIAQNMQYMIDKKEEQVDEN